MSFLAPSVAGGRTAAGILVLTFGVASLAGCGSSADTPASTQAGSGGSGATGGSATRGGTGGTGGGETFTCASDASPGAVVAVDAGPFDMGCNEEDDDACEADEKPRHEVSLDAFAIDVTEVTQDQYAACVVAGACPAPACVWDCDKTDYPASCVDWGGAQAYCVWAGKRLPTEAEWEKAARGDDGRIFPWGNDEADCTLANMSGCSAGALPAGSLPDGASPYGALDMAGNMVEMVADLYSATYYESSPGENPTGPASGDQYSGRGGGFKSDAEWLRASKRDWYDLDDEAVSLGFRCAQ